jgi:transposase
MPSRKELSPQTRSRICELHSIGYGAKRIHNIHWEISLSTIKYTIKKESVRVNNQSLPRSGTPRKLSEEEKDHLYDHAIHKNPHIKIRELVNEIDHDISKDTIRRAFREMHKKKWLQKVGPEIHPHHAAQRLAWANRYAHFTPDNWKQVRWTDECTIERGEGIRHIYTFNPPTVQLREHDVKVKRCGKSVKQMFWAGFGYDIRTGLVPLDGDPDSPRGGVSSRVIRDLYEAFLPGFIQPGNIFMHDNAPVHTAHIIRRILEELRVEVMIYPPYSPDLNPIENLWAIMKAKIYELYPHLEYAPDSEATLNELIKAAKEAWQVIDERVLQHLSNTMPHRVQAIITADGWYTKY